MQTEAYSAVNRTIGSPLGMNGEVSAIESQTHQSQVHNLYNKLIAGDLESSRKKTQIQLEVER